MRTLVTGGGGFIGSNLATRLAADGRDVVAVDTFAEGRWNNLVDFARHGGDVAVLADPLDEEMLRRLGPFDSVFHQAAVTGVIGPDGSADTSPAAERQILANNVGQFRIVLDLAAEWKATVVYASSCSVYGRGPVPMREAAPPIRSTSTPSAKSSRRTSPPATPTASPSHPSACATAMSTAPAKTTKAASPA